MIHLSWGANHMLVLTIALNLLGLSFDIMRSSQVPYWFIRTPCVMCKVLRRQQWKATAKLQGRPYLTLCHRSSSTNYVCVCVFVHNADAYVLQQHCPGHQEPNITMQQNRFVSVRKQIYSILSNSSSKKLQIVGDNDESSLHTLIFKIDLTRQNTTPEPNHY